MRKILLIGLLSVVCLLPTVARAELGIGGGIFYNRQLGKIRKEKDFDKDFVSYMLSVKYQVIDMIGLEGSLDYYNGNGKIDYTLRPMGTAVLSIPLPILDLFNVGVGINTTYTRYKKENGDSTSDWPKLGYHFKAGIQIPIANLIWICGDCYYFVDDLRDIEDFDSDLLTFGARAMIRF